VPWLLRDDEVLATVEVCSSFGDRAKGLVGRRGIEGALVLPGSMGVHTVGVRFGVDVAYCDRNMRVRSISHLRRFRIAMPRIGAHAIVVAPIGSFERWRLGRGDQLEIWDGSDG
jgi:uncharacterized membrane protein (UPF0127 family)